MRSLTPTKLKVASLAGLDSPGHAAAVAVDAESGGVYIAVETLVDEGGLEVEIVRINPDSASLSSPEVIGSFSSPALAPFPLSSRASKTVDLHYFPDDRSLVILLAGGDIATLQLEAANGASIEVVGSVDSGIKAATWSPDEEVLVLITGEDKLVCMTRIFDTIHEEPLRTDDFGEDQFINVGWGSKSTQFHGSIGKAAAQASSSGTSSTIPKSLSHSSDDGLPRITFRGDAAFFAVSSLDPYCSSTSHARRQIRIYSRDGPRLSATSESLPGLEPPIAWRPSGNVLSSLVRYGYKGGGEGNEGRWEVAMLERNGLRHGGFELREKKEEWKKARCGEMAWNADSEVLAIWFQRQDEDVIQLWSMKNYRYYLKQEIFSHKQGRRRFQGFRWHPEQPLTIYLLGENYVQIRSFAWDTYAARLPMPHDTASVAVVDGDRVLITPFRTQNTPASMASYTLRQTSTPIHASFSSVDDSIAVVSSNGLVRVWYLDTRLPDPKAGSRFRGGGRVAKPELRWELNLAPTASSVAKQVALGRDGQVAVLFWTDGPHAAGMVVEADSKRKCKNISLTGDVERLLWSHKGWLSLDASGTLRPIDANDGEGVALCPHPRALALSDDSSLVFALSSSGKLHFASMSLNTSQDSNILASSVSSFTLTTDFLIYTTSSQNSQYVPLSDLIRIADGDDKTAFEKDWDGRRVERGALCVVACPSSMSLVLQMPRGNLETIYPRPLVLAVVRRDVLAGKYRSAFITCRKHRLDLNILYDLDPVKFMASLPSFVEQIPEVDHLNLFVSSLSEADSSRTLFYRSKADTMASGSSLNKVNSLCDSLRDLLEIDLVKYVETILTTHVSKQPPDYEAGLRVLLKLQAEHQDIVEDAIKYIIFLSDAERLYDVALGMYSFQLVLMIAQYSQKDPKEYLPFLRELRALDKWEQRFRIDDHLGRRASALRNLQHAGPSRFEDASSYLARYELYDEAFKVYADDHERLPAIYDLYGDYLYDRRDCTEAALAYTLAAQPEKTLKAYEKAHAWRELFTLALQQKMPKQAIAELCERVTDHLASSGKHLEAARVFLDYAQDVNAAVDVLCRGTEFSEAYRMASWHGRSDLVEGVIHPGLETAQESLIGVFEEMEGQLDKESNRLVELRKVREDDPDTFYIVDNMPALEGVDVATNATTVASAFTRYTVAPTTAFSRTTKITGQSAKSKHKPSKKRATGRKGTVDEYEYLLSSIARLVTRLDGKSEEATVLLRHLLLASPDHRELGKSLQATVINLHRNIRLAIDDAWRDREVVWAGVMESGGSGLGGNVDKAREAVKPVVAEWKGLGVLS